MKYTSNHETTEIHGRLQQVCGMRDLKVIDCQIRGEYTVAFKEVYV